MIKIIKGETISLDIDAQKGFTPLCPNELPVPNGHEIVSELNKQAKFAHYRAGSKDAHPNGGIWEADNNHPVLSPVGGCPNVDLYWPKHCVVGTKGFESLDGLPHPSEYDFFVYKGLEKDMHPYGACFHDLKDNVTTGLLEFIDFESTEATVIVGGLATDYCVFTTVMQIVDYLPWVRVILNLGACRGVSFDTTSDAIIKMQNKGVIIINSADELELEG